LGQRRHYDLGVESDVVGVRMQVFSTMPKMRSASWILALVAGLIDFGICHQGRAAAASYEIDKAVAVANDRNPDVIIATKRVEAARGGLTEARSGYLPSVVASGFADNRETQNATDLRGEDYSSSVRVLENVYTGGAVSNQVAIARLNVEKQQCELEEVRNKITMDVRVAFYDVLLNRAKVGVHENSVRVLNEELKAQEERQRAGIVGNLNVHRAEVAVANEQPELANARTQLKNSYLHLAELLGSNSADSGFEVAGQLQYEARHPDLKDCLGRADAKRAEIHAREIDVRIEDRQYLVDKSELRPRVQAFSGYEVYNERDPFVGPEFNNGYLLGLSGTWHVFDGYATKGRMQATKARRDAAATALDATRRAIASEVRSAFFDLEQADKVLEPATKSVQTADESLEITKSNLAAGLGTQLDILQAAADVTRTRTTRLSAIYLHNVALARLARACGSTPEALDFASDKFKPRHEKQAVDLAHPPEKLTKQ